MICLRSLVYPRGPGAKIVIPPNHHMMAERFCTLDGHPKTATDALASFSAGPKAASITGLPSGFD